MSAYVVENSTIDRIAAWVYTKSMGSMHNWMFRTLQSLGYLTDRPEGVEKLAQAMFWLNVEAVNERYGEFEAEQFRPLDYEYTLIPPVGVYQTLKSLKCWLYQCSEGNVPETELFKAMQQLAYDIMEEIVNATEEYELAEWA